MIIVTCKCGAYKSWVSGMPLYPCQVCDDCGTPLAFPGEIRLEPIPHDWRVKYDEDTGEPKYEMCARCWEIRPYETKNENIG